MDARSGLRCQNQYRISGATCGIKENCCPCCKLQKEIHLKDRNAEEMSQDVGLFHPYQGHRLPRRRPIEQLTHPHVFCQYKHNQDIMNVRNGLNSRGLKFLELLAAKPYQHEKKREKKRKKIPMFGNGHPVFAISSWESLMTPVIRQSEDIAFILNC